MKRIGFVIGVMFAFFGIVSAQDEVPKQISGGVLNGKAISLPKPPYPAAAKAVGASGAVSVQVLIDENGDVVSASAVSGHPLLRAAAVEAAQSAKFAPTKLQGNPVKVSGVITYNFVGPLSLTRLVFRFPTPTRLLRSANIPSPASLASQLPDNWTEEKEILNALTFEEGEVAKPKADEKKEAQKTPSPDQVGTPQIDTKNRYTVKGDANYSAASWSGSYAGGKLDAKSIASVQRLIRLVETRASVSEAAAWGHELGIALGIFVAEMEDHSKFASNLARMESLAEKAPNTVNQSNLQRVKEFVEVHKTEGITDESRQNLLSKAEMLSNLRY